MRKSGNTWTRPILASALAVALGVGLYHVWVVRPSVRKVQAAAEAAARPGKPFPPGGGGGGEAAGGRAPHPPTAADTATPQQDSFTDRAKAWQAALEADLLTVHAQLELYRFEHLDRYPTLDGFVAAMTGTTDADGDPDGTDFGPYLLAVPTNPWTGGASIGDGPLGSSDWHYDERTGRFRPNHLFAPAPAPPADRPVGP